MITELTDTRLPGAFFPRCQSIQIKSDAPQFASFGRIAFWPKTYLSGSSLNVESKSNCGRVERVEL